MYDLFLNKKALIVDDFSEFRVSLRSMLESFGCQHIDSVRNGSEAVLAYQKARHDIVLCDYNLGVDQNGQQVLEEISLQGWLRADGAFVMVTAETTLNMVMGALEFRPDEYLTKPINKANLRARLEKILKQKSALIDVYKALNQRNYLLASAYCKQHIASGSRYKGLLYRIMAESLLRQDKYKQAGKLYQQFVNHRPAQWSLLGLAQCHYMANDLDKCIQVAKQTIEESSNSVEAYDLLAHCYSQQGQYSLAHENIEEALQISPLSIRRQRLAASIAAHCGDEQSQLKALQQIHKLGQHSVQADLDDQAKYLCLLLQQVDAASGLHRRRMLSEAQQQLGAMQKKAKLDPNTSEREKCRNLLLQCNLSAILGDQQGATDCIKLASPALQESLEQQDQLMLSLFKQSYSFTQQQDKAAELSQQIEKSKKARLQMEQKASLSQANKQGIEAYEKGEITDAISRFRKAHEEIPYSTAILLNLVQALMKQPQRGESRIEIRTECLKLLEQQRLLPEDDPRYSRYQNLLKKAQSL